MRIAKAWAGCSVVVSTLALAGCYAPSIRRCELACASGDQCPDGLTCNANNMCASSRDDLCTGGTGSDGSIDVPTDVPRDGACTWRPTSNVEPCALDADLAMTDFAVNGTMTVDTSLAALSASQLTGEPIALVKVRDLIIGPAGNVVVTGNRPLVILVARTARIEGRIGYVAAGDPGAGFICAGTGGMGTGGLAGTVGSGGGGGGHGTIGMNVSGASGGLVPAGFFGAGGIVVGDGRLVPLTMGCAGGRGGGGTDPGRGGGSIQISARGSLVVSGRIEAGGGGGGNAMDIAAGSGGGAGGGILLEAETLIIGGAQLCANGGGGGAGGASTSSAPGQDASCSLTAARGGGSGTARLGGAGAAGTVQALAGQGASLSGAGGGGGGPGWIRLNGVQMGSPMLSTPAFSAGS